MSQQATAMLSAIGKDRTGLANSVTHRLHGHGCTIEEAVMETLGAYFVVLIQFSGTGSSVRQVLAQLPTWGEELGLEFQAFDHHQEQAGGATQLTYYVRVDALERAGIISELTGTLSACDVNVKKLEGKTIRTALSGEARFVVEALVELPEAAQSAVWEAMDETGLDYVLFPATESEAASEPSSPAPSEPSPWQTSPST